MTMRLPLGLGATLLAWATCAPAQAYDIAFREASIPMPDGVKLAADLYLPQPSPRSWAGTFVSWGGVVAYVLGRRKAGRGSSVTAITVMITERGHHSRNPIIK